MWCKGCANHKLQLCDQKGPDSAVESQGRKGLKKKELS